MSWDGSFVRVTQHRMSRLAPATLFTALAIAALPLPAQVSLQPAEAIPLPAQHSYFIGLEIPTQTHNSGQRLLLLTTQESYSSPVIFNPVLGWQKEFDLTPFNVNLFEPYSDPDEPSSSVAINPVNPGAYYFTGGLSLNRSIRFQQSPIAVTDNQRIGNLQLIPGNIILRAPTTPGGPVEVFYTVNGYGGDTPGIYRHANADLMPWTNSTGVAASSGVGALRFGPDGLLNVIDTLNHRITRYNPDTLAYVSDFALGNTHTDRNAFVITSSGFVFTTFADSAGGAIYSYATGAFLGNYGLDTTLDAGNGFGGKTSMTVDPDTGLVYVLTANSAGEGLFAYHSIDLMDPAVGTIHTFQPGDVRASALAVSSLHYLSLASGTATQSGVISGSGTLTKKGFGTLVLSASNTYTGGTTVDNGTLLAAFTGEKGTFADHSTVTVNYWGTLAVDGESLGSGAGNTAIVLNRGTLSTVSTTGQGTTLRDVTMIGGLITQSGNGRFILDGSISVTPSLTRARIDADLELRNATFNVPQSADPEAELWPLTITSTLSGSSSLVKNGDGTLYFNGTGTYTGDTFINAGRLVLGDQASLASPVVHIANGATLQGTGSFGGLVTLSGGAHLTPGSWFGTMTFGGGLTLDAGSVISLDLGNPSDLIRVSGGTLTGPTGGKVIVNLANSHGFRANTYTLFDFSGATLDDFDAADFQIGTGIAGYDIGGYQHPYYHYAFVLTGSSLQLIASESPIPEPSTYAMIAGLVALGLAILRRRRNADGA